MKRSFTFIELLIVIAIISTFSLLTFPRIKNTLNRFQLDNFARNIYYLCLYLQDTAARQGSVYCLNIDRNSGQVRGVSTDSTLLHSLDGRFGKVYHAPTGVTVASEKTGVCFYPDASADDINIIFEDTAENKVILTILGATGEIKIE